MKYKIATLMYGGMLALVCTNVGAVDVLRYNPFEQPDMAAGSSQSNANNSAGNEMKLRGTVVDGDDSMVNISGKYYRLNQEVAGYSVVHIESASVTLRRGSTETVLTLHDE